MAITNSENIFDKYASMTAHANVKFLAGSQLSLNNLMTGGGATEGAFYLTNDTHRLYIGRKESGTNKIVPVPVNEGITTVENLATLEAITDANVGDFYYVETQNILAVCSSTSGSGNSRTCSWVQMNSNSTIDTFTQAVSLNNKTATITSQITQTAGAATKTADFSVIAGDNVTITVNGREITFTAQDTTYTVSTRQNSTNTGDAELTLTPSVNGAAGTAQVVTVTSEDSSIDIDGSTAGTIKLKGVNDIAASTVSTGNGGWAINVKKDGDAIGTGAAIAPLITYGTTGNKSTAKFLSGTADLDIYTKTQADSAISTAIQNALTDYDALQFVSTISGDSTASNYLDTKIQSAGIHNGDVFIVSDTSTYTGTFTSRLDPAGYTSWRTGDMIIASGSETNGVISTGASSDLVLYVVPAGNEAGFVGYVASTATGNHAANSVELWQNSVDSGAEVVGFNLASGTDGKIVVGTSVTGTHATMTLSHNTVTRNNTAANELNNSNANTSLVFYAPVANSTNGFGITTDSTGHVTGVEMAKVTVTHNKLKTIANQFGTVSDAAAVTLTQTFSDDINNDISQTMTFNSSTMKFTATNTNAVTVDIQWETF